MIDLSKCLSIALLNVRRLAHYERRPFYAGEPWRFGVPARLQWLDTKNIEPSGL